MKLLTVLMLCIFSFGACAERNPASTASQTSGDQTASGENVNNTISTPEVGSRSEAKSFDEPDKTETAESQTNQPRTVRDFFMLLPEKYFVLEDCNHARDKNCRQSRLDYLKTFAEVEDTKNGYLKGGCDGAQACIEMALFKRPDGAYLIGVGTFAEMMNDYYFLDYKNGKWTDVSAQVVPEFSKKNMYELPRYGTTVKVFAKKIIEEGNQYGDKYEISEKGARLYDMEWKDGKFTIKR
jgi:hypothetical protein